MRKRGLGKTTLAVIEGFRQDTGGDSKAGHHSCGCASGFPVARIVPRKSEFEMWLEAQGVPEAHRQVIVEEAARWVLKDGRWERATSKVSMRLG